MEYRLLIVLTIFVIQGALCQNQDTGERKNPIISLFETPLKAFRTKPGEAIAVFQPEVIRVQARQQANESDSSSSTSWFPSTNIQSSLNSAAQQLLPGWLAGRLTSTTPKPEIIIQVQQNDRPRPQSNRPSKNKDEEESDEDDEEDEDDRPKKKKRRQQNDQDDEDDDDEEIEQRPSSGRRGNNRNGNVHRFSNGIRRPNFNNNRNQQRRRNTVKNRNQNNRNRIQFLQYDFEDDPNEDFFFRNNNELKRNLNNLDNDDEDKFYEDYDDEEEAPMVEKNGRQNVVNQRRRISIQRVHQNRRQQPEQNQKTGNDRDKNDREEIYIRMKLTEPVRNGQRRRGNNRVPLHPTVTPSNDEFLQAFQDIPALTRPIRYGPNDVQQKKPIGVLQQEYIDEQLRRKRQQKRRQKLKDQQQMQQQLQQQKQRQKQKQQMQDQEDQEDEDDDSEEYEHSDNPGSFQQSQHILIPIHVLPQTIPYKDVVPQVVPQHIQVVAQHHHTVEHSTDSDEDTDSLKPQKQQRGKRPKPQQKRKQQVQQKLQQQLQQHLHDSDEEDDVPIMNKKKPQKKPEADSSEEAFNTAPNAHPTRRPMVSNNNSHRNKFEENRHKPSKKQFDSLDSEADTSKSEMEKPVNEKSADKDRPDAPSSNEDMNSEEMNSEEMNSEEMHEDEKKNPYDNTPFLPPGLHSVESEKSDEKETKSVEEGRAQYYLPQRYYKILGTDNYLAVSNDGRFLLKTGRNLDLEKMEEKLDEKLTSAPVEAESKPEDIKIQSAEQLKNDKPEMSAIENEQGTPDEDKVKAEESKDIPIEEGKSEPIEIQPTKPKPVEAEHIKSEPAEAQLKVESVQTPEQSGTVEPQKVETAAVVTEKPPVTDEKRIPVMVVKSDEQNVAKQSEKPLVRSEIVSEKQNGHFIVRSQLIPNSRN